MSVNAEYSKRHVNKAGSMLREFRTAIRTDPEAWERFGPSKIDDAIAVVDHWRGLHARPLARVNTGLRYYIKKADVDSPEVTQRLKRFSTIVHKLERERGMALTRMEDIGGVRAILPTQDQVLRVAQMLDEAKRWTIRRQRFYIDGGNPGPKDDGYRAVHLIVVKDGCFVEIQLRTPRQDVWAQSVEQDTRRLREELKFGGGPGDLREYYRASSEYLAMIETSVEPTQDFMEDLAKLYAASRRYFPQ